MTPAEESFCGFCGFRTGGGACPACGRSPQAQAQEPAARFSPRALAPSPADFPDLAAAFEAWGQRDNPKMIAACLGAIGVRSTSPVRLERGLGWLFGTRSSFVFVSLHHSGELAMESPLVLIPATQRVPLFRSLLELNVQALGAARFCVRNDRVVLRFADQAENVAPPKFVDILRAVAGASDHFSQLLGVRFNAPLLAPEVKKAKDPFSLLGVPKELELGAEAALPTGPMVKQSMADEVVELSARTFGASFETSSDELELAYDPLAGRVSPVHTFLGELKGALELAQRVSSELNGLFALVTLRAALFKFRAYQPVEVQGVLTYLLLSLGDWLQVLPEPGFKTGRGRPSPAELAGTVEQLIADQGQIDGRLEGKIFPLPPLKPPDAKAHVRRFMSVYVKCPRDEAVRVLLLEGALFEMLLRARPAPAQEEPLVALLSQRAPPSQLRLNELQNALTRGWA